jgi:Antitoxin Xre-like helix-turn-helix domain
MFRAVLNLFRLWGLTDEEAATLVDMSVRSYRRWKGGEIGRLGRDGKARLSNLMGIRKALRIIFREPQRAYSWVKAPNQASGPIRHSAARALSTSCLAASSRTWCGCGAIWTASGALGDRGRRVPDLTGHGIEPSGSFGAPIRLSISSRTSPIRHTGRLSSPSRRRIRASRRRNIDLIPANRRVGGPGASCPMAPFNHASEDRPSDSAVKSTGSLRWKHIRGGAARNNPSTAGSCSKPTRSLARRRSSGRSC